MDLLNNKVLEYMDTNFPLHKCLHDECAWMNVENGCSLAGQNSFCGRIWDHRIPTAVQSVTLQVQVYHITKNNAQACLASLK